MHRNQSVAALLALCLLPWCTAAWAKPKTVWVDQEIDEAEWVAEAEVLEAGPAGNARVRISSDPEGVFRGFALLGKTVEVSPTGTGSGCSHFLQGHAGKGNKVLLVVRKGGEIVLGGARTAGEKEAAYNLTSWYDFNACFVVSKDKEFGVPIGEDGKPLEKDAWKSAALQVKAATIALRLKKDREQFQAKAALFLLGENSALGQDELNKHLAAFESEAPEDRERAQKALIAGGALAIPYLKKVAHAAKDPEVKARVSAVLSALSEYAAACDVAEQKRKAGVEGEARILADAHPHLTAKQMEAAVARLKELAASATPKLDCGAGDAESVLKAWRERVRK